jgi:large subunit ribosomal protein L17
MVIRQQVSAMIANNHLTTTHARAKEVQRHVDRIINLAKNPTLANKRLIMPQLINTNDKTVSEILNKAIEKAKKMLTRNGGYTKVLKLGGRLGDNTEEAILQFSA